ncbi:NAD(P)/FAD-dependent oxidoreductase [Halomonas urumqiensis]|uniref:NAD(P)/FAD-dependent oxidoreductase n=1 Tax=Halomonas urumqiensis TaxID=1684789 RepID=A0A2N7UD60_9GAMM|nr:FAD-dependent oxidoreductase [Halomonas urumqiensis]PMR78357.1 NAD(P)/FAD-dependent oxidoreductase [Halomonas urumqiensis]PTB03504.1 NAD(P)/FAD-dependent oxidoreductase [Halomonas urumqiensis]GHE20308.1 hypothetical protein GCM10017767_08290 [Halomonas urumqiensis]
MRPRHPDTSAPNSDAPLVIVGNGMAGHRLVEALLKQAAPPRHIVVIGEERSPAYNRILLSPLLAGEMEANALTLRNADWYAEQGVTLMLGERVEHIHRERQQLTTSAGHTLGYGQLVLATGSRPAMPPLPGLDLEGVYAFRDLDDAAALTKAAAKGGNAVVIGGGLLGLEAAEGLRKRGMGVTLIQRDDRLMNRQLDDTAAGMLEVELTGRGLGVITNGHIAELADDRQGRVAGVRLEDGTWLPATCVVVAIGIAPNAELGRQAGLGVERAIVVDDHLATSDPAIFALGECCQFDSNLYGLVEPIWRQVEVLAAHLCSAVEDEPVAGYVESPTATKLKISGVSLYAFGPTDADEHHDVLVYHDPDQGEYRRLLLRDGRLEGAVLYGDTSMGPWYFAQALAGRDLTLCRSALLLGAADADALLDSSQSPDSTNRPVKEAA